jgi:hypothetical protein
MTPLDRLLKDIDPNARLVSIESEIIERGETEPGYAESPVCDVHGAEFEPLRFEPPEGTRGGEVAYRVATIRFDADGYSPAEYLGENGPSCPCCDDCWDDAQRRLMRDRLEVVEEALRLVPVVDATVDWRARAIEACEETRRAS